MLKRILPALFLLAGRMAVMPKPHLARSIESLGPGLFGELNMNGLVQYDAACRALDLAKSIDEVKDIRDKSEAVRAYARQAKNRNLEIDAAEIRMRAERRLGAMLAEQKATNGFNTGAAGIGTSAVPKENRTPTLSEIGVDKKLSSRAQKLAELSEDDFENRINVWRDNLENENERVTTEVLRWKNVRGTFGTGQNEWYTPPEFIEMARTVMGSIDLDPCSTPYANETVKAAKIYTIDDNGLELPWAGNVWLNPPYSQPDIGHFCERVVQHWIVREITSAIILTHNYTDTTWFHRIAPAAVAMCFTRGRVKFTRPDGTTCAPTQGQCFTYMGDEPDIFADVFSQAGFVMVPHG